MLAPTVVLCLAISAFAPALMGEFVFDDLPALVNNRDVHPDNQANLTEILHHDFWGDSIASSQSHKSYRPLTVLVFKSISTFGLDRPFAFHLVNLAVHAANSGLVYAFLRRIPIADRICSLTALLFAVHPVHCESVAPAVGLADLLYSLLALACLVIDSENPTWFRIPVIALFSASAVFVKEQGIMIIPMVIAVDFLKAVKSNRRRKYFMLKCLLLGGVALITFYLRMRAIDFEPPAFHQQDNPVSSQDSPFKRLLSQNYIYALNVAILLAPIWLCFDWAMGCVPLIERYDDVRIAVVVAFWLGLAAVARAALGELRRMRGGTRRPLVCLSVALAVLPFVPALNLFFRVGFVIAERNLYLSVLGFSLLVSTGADCILRQVKGPIRTCVWLLLALTISCLFSRSFSRSHEWTSEERLFTSGLKVCPDNAKVHYNIAKLAADGGRDDIAVVEYREALRLYPNYEQALNNLANIYKSQKKPLEARDLLQRAVDVNARFPAAWMNLGIVQASLGDFEMAELSYKRALGVRRAYPDCHYNLGNLYVKWGKTAEAGRAFREAVTQNRQHRAAWANLITLLDDTEDFEAAAAVALEAIGLFPQESDFHFQLANVYGKMGRYEISEEKYLSSLALRESSVVWSNLGVLYHRWKKPQAAANSYRKALLLDPNNASAKRNLKSLKLQ